MPPPFPRLDFTRLSSTSPAGLQAHLSSRGVPDAAALASGVLEARRVQLAMRGAEEALRRRRNAGEGVDRDALREAAEAAERADSEVARLAGRLPNWTHPDVPVGGEERAVERARGGRELGKSSTATVDHVELCARHGLADFKAGAAVAGSKFVFLKGRLALMELALQRLALGRLVDKGFTPVATPDMVHAGFLEACGFHPRGENTQVYAVENTDLVMVGTSEIPLAASLMGTRLDPKPGSQIRLAGFGHCFRTEAGSAGASSRGLYRLHQFTKVEMYCATLPSESEAVHEELVGFVTHLCDDLQLTWRVLDMPTLELGASAYRKFDVEVWMPGSKRWGEIASLTNCTDYQSRRLDIKVKGGDFAHTLNATACAIPRILLSLLETHYDPGKDRVVLPPAVQEAAGFAELW